MIRTYGVTGLDMDVEANSLNNTAGINGAVISSVNIMVFDYYLAGKGVLNMAAAARHAARSVHTQLASVYPADTSAQLWAIEGMT